MVLVHLRRGFAVIEWYLAILKCGGAIVYLDHEASERRKAAFVSNCKPTLIVNGALLEEAMLGDLEDTSHSGNESGLDYAKYSTSDDDLAYVIYTPLGQPASRKASGSNMAMLPVSSRHPKMSEHFLSLVFLFYPFRFWELDLDHIHPLSNPISTDTPPFSNEVVHCRTHCMVTICKVEEPCDCTCVAFHKWCPTHTIN